MSWAIVLSVFIAVAGAIVYNASTSVRLTRDEAAAMFNLGVGALDQYDYGEAHRIFERLAQIGPRRAEVRVNKGLAALNLQKEFLEVAEEDFRQALLLDPEIPHAHFGLGILYRHTGRFEPAIEAFRRVAELDPGDPYAPYWLGACLVDSGRPADAIAHFEKSVELQPALASALYRLSTLFRVTGQAEKGGEVFERYREIEKDREGVLVGLKYGESGPYSQAVRQLFERGASDAPDGDSALQGNAPALTVLEAVIESPPMLARRPDGEGARLALAVGDLDADGHEDFVVGGQANAPEAAARAEVWRAEPGAAKRFARAVRLDRDASACALGDLDNDRDLDLVLADSRRVDLLVNDGQGQFTTEELQFPAELPGFPVSALVLDADGDWDLDVAIACQVSTGDGAALAGRLVLLGNRRDGTFTDVAAEGGFADLPAVPRDFLFADLDGDADQDFVLLGEGGALHVLINDRSWRYRTVRCTWPDGSAFEEAELVSVSFDEIDSQPVLELFATGLPSRQFKLAPDGSLRPWIGAPDPYSPVLPLQLGHDVSALIPGPDGQPRWLVGGEDDPLLLLGKPLGGAWIAFDLHGPLAPTKSREGGMWSNLSGIGGLIDVSFETRKHVMQVNGSGGGSSRSSQRVYVALPRGAEAIDYVRILWPDGLLQSERGLATGEVHVIEERDRKPTSCPLLFAFDGERFDYVGDFLGVGGLGYYLGAGRYNQPDPSEVLEIPALRPSPDPDRPGKLAYEMRVVEPLEECAYIDSVELVAVDHPEDVTVHAEEMFAVAAPKPEFRLAAFRTRAPLVAAVDHEGRDVLSRLEEIDRVYAEGFEKDPRFHGMAQRDHAIELDFGDGLDRVIAEGGRPLLFLYGYIEYSYSTSNFAATQAGVVGRVPSVSVERRGAWVSLREQWGFPAGTPRWMAVDLAGLLQPGDRRLRVDTNLEIYWDHAVLVAAHEPAELGARMQVAAVDRARLRQLGFPQDSFPDGRHPRIYDYHDIVPPPEVLEFEMNPFAGRYTRPGDVRELLVEADDRYVIIGPGDEITLRVDAERFPEVPSGWRRTFFFKTHGWCKDTDPYTGHGGTVEPWPFRAMESYPHPEGAGRHRRRFWPIRNELAPRASTTRESSRRSSDAPRPQQSSPLGIRPLQLHRQIGQEHRRAAHEDGVRAGVEVACRVVTAEHTPDSDDLHVVAVP